MTLDGWQIIVLIIGFILSHWFAYKLGWDDRDLE
jgi:hypothetical protein